MFLQYSKSLCDFYLVRNYTLSSTLSDLSVQRFTYNPGLFIIRIRQVMFLYNILDVLVFFFGLRNYNYRSHFQILSFQRLNV